MKKRKILFITGSRSDFYIQKPILDAVKKSTFLSLLLIVTGSHLSKKFGFTINEILKEKYNIVAKIKNLVVSDNPLARLKSASKQLSKLVEVISRTKPDIMIAPFDREESITIAVAGAYTNTPVVHLGAGDRTRFNIDGIIRHSVTKLSNIFFCFTKESAKRVVRLGEEKWRVHTVGHTAAYRYKNTKSVSKSYLSQYLNLNIKNEPLIIFIQHPVSNWLKTTKKNFKTTLHAIDELNLPTIIIGPNSDPGNLAMKLQYLKFKFSNKKVKYFKNLPEKIFINVIKKSSVLLGNSSMGVLEAPLVKLPVVNVGLRQKDRQNAGNILFVTCNKNKIIKAIKKSLYNKKYLKKIRSLKNPYGVYGAPEKVVKVLSKISINDKLISKKITY